MIEHTHKLGIKRVYEPPAKSDGTRVLIDRIWPRGLSKDEARVDHWLKDIAPSTQLRKWFGHEVERWPRFRTAYREELRDNAAVAELGAMLKQGTVTLVYGAHDEEHNNAVVLAEFMADRR